MPPAETLACSDGRGSVRGGEESGDGDQEQREEQAEPPRLDVGAHAAACQSTAIAAAVKVSATAQSTLPLARWRQRGHDENTTAQTEEAGQDTRADADRSHARD